MKGIYLFTKLGVKSCWKWNVKSYYSVIVVCKKLFKVSTFLALKTRKLSSVKFEELRKRDRVWLWLSELDAWKKLIGCSLFFLLVPTSSWCQIIWLMFSNYFLLKWIPDSGQETCIIYSEKMTFCCRLFWIVRKIYVQTSIQCAFIDAIRIIGNNFYFLDTGYTNLNFFETMFPPHWTTMNSSNLGYLLIILLIFLYWNSFNFSKEEESEKNQFFMFDSAHIKKILSWKFFLSLYVMMMQSCPWKFLFNSLMGKVNWALVFF